MAAIQYRRHIASVLFCWVGRDRRDPGAGRQGATDLLAILMAILMAVWPVGAGLSGSATASGTHSTNTVLLQLAPRTTGRTTDEYYVPGPKNKLSCAMTRHATPGRRQAGVATTFQLVG